MIKDRYSASSVSAGANSGVVVEEEVKFTEPVDRLLYHIPNLIGIPHIRLNEESFATLSFNLFAISAA